MSEPAGLSEFDRNILSWLEGGTREPVPSEPVPAPVPEPAAAAPARRRPRRWPLLIIAAPAAVAIWSGWVALGAMCGFGYVHPLPGIVPGFHLDTAITLPVGVEAYGTYALGVWLNPDTPVLARTFARWSAIGSLLLGILGQVAYHLILHAGLHKAPWPVVVAVSCLPVITLGFGAALTHLLHRPAGAPAEGAAETGTPVPEPPAELNGHAAAAAEMFAELVAAGRVPGVRTIRRGLQVGQPKAQQVREYLRQLAAAAHD